MTKVYVDPACNINYSSFYIKGLWDLFGKENVIFTSRPFHQLIYTADSHCLAFIIDERKYIIDFADSNKQFYDKFLEWSDLYGKVNYNHQYIPSQYKNKIVPVGPNFGIGCFGDNKWSALVKCVTNYLRCHKRVSQGFGSYLSPYLWLYKRSSIKLTADPSTIGSRKIFMVSRYWKDQHWVNDSRIAFIRACQKLSSSGLIEFIGGLVPDAKNTDCPEDVIFGEELPFDRYMSIQAESLLVFNTPSYHHCHGWRLPEYLAHGKIVLSTPLINELSVPLVHRKNIFFSESDEMSIYYAIKEIVSDLKLQKQLECGSRQYWLEHANPASSIKRFIYGS